MPKIILGRKFLLSQQKLCLGASEIKEGRFEIAEKYLSQAIRLEPSSGNGYYLYGKCLEMRGQQQKSKTFLNQAQILNPCFFDTLGNDLQKIVSNIIQLYDQAKECMKITGKSNDFKWQQVVDRFAKKKDLNTSLQVLQLFQVVKRENKQYSAHLFSTIGITYYQIGQYEQSQKNYQIAIQMRNNQYRYYNNSAILQYIFKNYQKSQSLVEKSLSLNAGYPKSLFIVSFSLCKVGRIQQAIQKINFSIDKDRNSVMYRMKKITLLLSYFPEKTTEVINELTLTYDLINQKKDTDSYFTNKDNVPLLKAASKFLLENIQYREAIQQDWRVFVDLLDDFLIRGHTDKYNISVKMMKLIIKMKTVLAEFGLIMNQQQKKGQEKTQAQKQQEIGSLMSREQIQSNNQINFDDLF